MLVGTIALSIGWCDRVEPRVGGIRLLKGLSPPAACGRPSSLTDEFRLCVMSLYCDRCLTPFTQADCWPDITPPGEDWSEFCPSCRELKLKFHLEAEADRAFHELQPVIYRPHSVRELVKWRTSGGRPTANHTKLAQRGGKSAATKPRPTKRMSVASDIAMLTMPGVQNHQRY